MALELLFPKQSAIEVSRSIVPFSAIACFTDHCDFDTLENLQQQRLFFKKHQIKVTKGFFLKHFSKRSDTASFEYHKFELNQWMGDGHELAYHSLSQSIKPLEKSIVDFRSFVPPFNDIVTWIDHGFQPYNVSHYVNYDALENDYGLILKSRGIRIIWNYIDTGTASKGVINQLNPSHFTLNSYYKGIKHLKFKNRIPMFMKNILFHFYNTEQSLKHYRILAKFYKTRERKKPFKDYLTLIKSILHLSVLISPVLIKWKTKKNIAYPLAANGPILFKHTINSELFTIFQTLELIDFKSGLHPSNLDILIKERGLFIAHTYFSAPMNYHLGRLFEHDHEVNEQVEHNFAYLSQKIKSLEVWNPTLKELVLYLENYQSLVFDCDEAGVLYIENNDHQLPNRIVV
jgi:hypothetical protein